MKPRTATDDQRAQIRGCLHSSCDTASDLTPIYLCDRGRGVCRLYEVADCERHEPFPERFNT